FLCFFCLVFFSLFVLLFFFFILFIFNFFFCFKLLVDLLLQMCKVCKVSIVMCNTMLSIHSHIWIQCKFQTVFNVKVSFSKYYV
ncbi:Uncharacterized protein APZ42_007144, partial [Daphnia magna]